MSCEPETYTHHGRTEAIMAQAAQAEATPQETRLIFPARGRSVVAAMALLIAGALAFTMGLNKVFFVRATAWTFVLWGALLMYGHIIDWTTTFEVTDEAFIVRSPLRFWAPKRVWDWDHIFRMDVVVDRLEAKEEDVVIQIYYQPEGSTVIHREDVLYIPELARLVVERAGLKPADKNQPLKSVEQIPPDVKGRFSFRK